MLGSAASGALSLMGSLAGAVTPMTEQGVADDWQAGKIDAQQFADRMSRVGGGATHVSLTDPNTGKQEKADSKAVTSNNKKNDDKTEEVSYADAVAQVKALRPDLSQEDIDLYLRSKGITPPKNKK
jgi:hypothetical protein